MQGVKKLENWMTFPEAASVLGITKQGFHRMIEVQSLIPLDQIRKVGDKPTYLVRTEAVTQLKDAREYVKKYLPALQNLVDNS